MLSLPTIMAVIDPFAQAFSGAGTWWGRAEEDDYAGYHEGLNRAVWSGLEVSGILLRVLLKTFDSSEALVFWH
jgi:hypothetical protein